MRFGVVGEEKDWGDLIVAFLHIQAAVETGQGATVLN